MHQDRQHLLVPSADHWGKKERTTIRESVHGSRYAYMYVYITTAICRPLGKDRNNNNQGKYTWWLIMVMYTYMCTSQQPWITLTPFFFNAYFTQVCVTHTFLLRIVTHNASIKCKNQSTTDIDTCINLERTGHCSVRTLLCLNRPPSFSLCPIFQGLKKSDDHDMQTATLF